MRVYNKLRRTQYPMNHQFLVTTLHGVYRDTIQTPYQQDSPYARWFVGIPKNNSEKINIVLATARTIDTNIFLYDYTCVGDTYTISTQRLFVDNKLAGVLLIPEQKLAINLSEEKTKTIQNKLGQMLKKINTKEELINLLELV